MEFVLGPSFPKYTPDHVAMIKAIYHINGLTPDGIYAVGLTFSNPSEQFTKEKIWQYRKSGLDNVQATIWNGLH